MVDLLTMVMVVVMMVDKCWGCPTAAADAKIPMKSKIRRLPLSLAIPTLGRGVKLGRGTYLNNYLVIDVKLTPLL